jgi:hypothetical protein
MIPIPSMLAGDLGGAAAPLPLNITHVGETFTSGFSTSRSISQPAGVQAGDVGILTIKVNNDPALTTSPATAGWTLLFTGVYYKVYGSSEGSVSWSWSSSRSAAGVLSVYRNVDNTTPIQSSNTTQTSSGTSFPSTALTPTTVRTRLVSTLRHQNGGTVTGVTKPTDLTLVRTINNGAVLVSVAHALGPAVGVSTGTPTWTGADATTDADVAMILLNPAPA